MTTIYAIYQIRNADEVLLDVPILYAFTNKKKVLDDFKKIRRMSIFNVIEKKISKDLYKEYAQAHKLKELTYRDIYTKSKISNGKDKLNLVLSWEELEKSLMYSDRIVNEIAKHTSGTIRLLKTEYIKALNTLGYLQFMEYNLNFSDPMDGFNISRYGFTINDYKKDNRIIDCDFDEFALIFYFYGYTFK